VRWTDTFGGTHVEPSYRVATQVKPTLVRVSWSYTHNAPDNDLFVRYGSGTNTNAAPFVRPTGGSSTADSTKVVVPVGFGSMTQYWFHEDLTEDSFVQDYLPPSAANPWFLAALEKGYVNTEGLVNAFSVIVYNGVTSTTYTAPNPTTPTVEGQTTTFWIPNDPTASANHNPVLTPIGNRSVAEGVPLTFAVHATDPDGNPITYATTPLPLGATFNAGTATFSWTPAYGQAGSYSIAFRATDNFLVPAADSERITIAVSSRTPGSNTPPTLVSIGDQTVRAGTALSLTVYASDTEGGALTYSTSTLPSGASFNAGTQMFAWPTMVGQDGTYLVTFRAADSQAAADSQLVRITVTPGVDQIPPSTDCSPDTTHSSGTVGIAANGMGTGPGNTGDVQYQPFTIAAGAASVKGSLSWTGGPAIDLDFELLDADSNVVAGAASLSDPEVVLVSNPVPGNYIWKIISFTNPNPTLAYTITSVQCLRPTGVSEPGVQLRLALEPNVPNPFTRATSIRFSLPVSGQVTLRVFDSNGRLMRTLVDGTLPAGVHQRVWDARDLGAHHAPAGVYFYRLETSVGVQTRKLIVVR